MKNAPPSCLRHHLASVATWLIVTCATYATPILITGPGSYSQNFDTLANSGTTNAWADDGTIAGWFSQRSGTGTTYAAGTGSGTGGGLYSFGSATSIERALGTIGSNNAAAGSFAHGILLQNTSGESVTINSLAYVGEEWRNGGVTSAQVVTLWYQVSGSAITSLTPASNTAWTALSSGDFSSPVNTATAGGLDGNAAENRTAISINPNIDVPNGSYVMIRWSDPDHSGSDHGLAIDDVAIDWIASATPGLGLSTSPGNFVENAGAGASIGSVTIPAALGTDLSVNLSSSDTTESTVPDSVTIIAGTTSATFPINAVDDFFADGTQSVTISASASGYISAQTGVSVENDTDTPINVSVLPSSLAENAGTGAATGTVTIAENVTSDLTINLSSNDTTEATVSATAIILAGTNSVTFAVDAVDDSDVDGTRNVNIGASSTGYSSGSVVIQVTDFGDTAPPATLSPGAIAFTGFNADGNDDFSFVALSTIAETDSILFTDNPWNGGIVGSGGLFSGSEGVIKWTAPSGGVAAGTIVTISSASTSGRTTNLGTATGVSGLFNLGSSGDTLYAYQGATFTPTGFLAAIATTNADSIIGTGLSASHVIYLASNIDIAAYTGSRSSQSTFAGYLTLLGDTANNWITQDGTGDQGIDTTAPDVPFFTTAFTLATGGSYASWTSTNSTSQAINQDHDGDGVPNGVEYFLGGNTVTASFTALPAVVNTAGTLSITWTKAADYTGTYGTDFVVETSSTLAAGSWTAETLGVNVVITGNSVKYTFPAGSKDFARLKVTGP